MRMFVLSLVCIGLIGCAASANAQCGGGQCGRTVFVTPMGYDAPLRSNPVLVGGQPVRNTVKRAFRFVPRPFARLRARWRG